MGDKRQAACHRGQRATFTAKNHSGTGKLLHLAILRVKKSSPQDNRAMRGSNSRTTTPKNRQKLQQQIGIMSEIGT
jgi:hypothetical protein